jgi:ribosomal protein L33
MAKGKRTNISFICKECGFMKSHSAATFRTAGGTGNTKKIKDLKMQKFCSKCRKHTEHNAKETKKAAK